MSKSVIVLALMVGAATVALGAPPPNDNCANATVVASLPYTDVTHSTDATSEPTDPAICSGGAGPTIWYSFTPPANGTYCARLCGSDYDTVLAAMNACGGPAFVCNDDACDLASKINFAGTAGVPVILEVARFFGFSSPGGGVMFTVADAAADSDGDGVTDCNDNCVDTSTPGGLQLDSDGDGVGNVCDPCFGPGLDDDGDGVCTPDDNCPNDPNPSQQDSDGDNYGDACDFCGNPGTIDPDGDGICDDLGDNCPGVFNPDQNDGDIDGLGDACDACLAQAGGGTLPDTDGDGRPDNCDACPNDPTDACATLWGCRSFSVTVPILVRLNPATGVASAVGNTSGAGADDCHGLAFEPATGRLLGGTGALYEFDTTTGAAARIGFYTGGGAFGDGVTELAFRSDGTLFAHGFPQRIGTVDPASGAVTDIGPTGLSDPFFATPGMAFDAGGTLWLANGSVLATVDQSTGAATPVAPLTFPATCTPNPRIDALTFAPSGTLLAALRCGGSRSVLSSIDTTTGVVSGIGETVPFLTSLAIERCGNGVREGGEQCDAGPSGGPCCSPSCVAVAAGTSCDTDADPCTADACNVVGQCTHDFPAVAGCANAGIRRAPVTLVAGPEPKLSWRWRGTVTDQFDFGPPTSATDLTVCIGDTVGHLFLSATAPQGGLCDGTPCWIPKTGGYDYRDRERTPDGIEKIVLRASPTPGKGRIKVKARGGNMSVVAPPYSAPVRVRLVRNDTGACWEGAYSSALRNDATTFKARSD
jgi:hypothetical protein